MDTAAIVSEIDIHLERLKQAHELLSKGNAPSRIKKPQTGLAEIVASAATKSRKSGVVAVKRVLSKEARERIVAAQKRRWTAYRKAARAAGAD